MPSNLCLRPTDRLCYACAPSCFSGITPRNPSILKLLRYTKFSENAGYGMDKIYSWERLTGEKVDIETN